MDLQSSMEWNRTEIEQGKQNRHAHIHGVERGGRVCNLGQGGAPRFTPAPAGATKPGPAHEGSLRVLARTNFSRLRSPCLDSPWLLADADTTKQASGKLGKGGTSVTH